MYFANFQEWLHLHLLKFDWLPANWSGSCNSSIGWTRLREFAADAPWDTTLGEVSRLWPCMWLLFSVAHSGAWGIVFEILCFLYLLLFCVLGWLAKQVYWIYVALSRQGNIYVRLLLKFIPGYWFSLILMNVCDCYSLIPFSDIGNLQDCKEYCKTHNCWAYS